VLADIYQDYIDGKKVLRVINMEFNARYAKDDDMDGVTPYRLEMQAKASVAGYNNLYDFWGDKLYGQSVMKQASSLTWHRKNIQSVLRNI
jgi:hypothetical protein